MFPNVRVEQPLPGWRVSIKQLRDRAFSVSWEWLCRLFWGLKKGLLAKRKNLKCQGEAACYHQCKDIEFILRALLRSSRKLWWDVSSNRDTPVLPLELAVSVWCSPGSYQSHLPHWPSVAVRSLGMCYIVSWGTLLSNFLLVICANWACLTGELSRFQPRLSLLDSSPLSFCLVLFSSSSPWAWLVRDLLADIVLLVLILMVTG